MFDKFVWELFFSENYFFILKFKKNIFLSQTEYSIEHMKNKNYHGKSSFWIAAKHDKCAAVQKQVSIFPLRTSHYAPHTSFTFSIIQKLVINRSYHMQGPSRCFLCTAVMGLFFVWFHTQNPLAVVRILCVEQSQNLLCLDLKQDRFWMLRRKTMWMCRA